MRDRTKTDLEAGLEDTVRQDNDEKINMLSKQISKIKGFTQGFQDSLKKSKNIMEGLGEKFEEGDNILVETTKKLGLVMSSNGSLFCYIVVFVVLIMIILYRMA